MTKNQLGVIKSIVANSITCGECKKLGIYDKCHKSEVGCVDFISKWFQENMTFKKEAKNERV